MTSKHSILQSMLRRLSFVLLVLSMGFASQAPARDINLQDANRPGALVAGETKLGPGCAWAPGFAVDGFGDSISAMATFDDELYIGGSFQFINGQHVGYIAKWDGQQWVSVGGGLNNYVDVLAVHNDGNGPALYAGGRFTVAGNVNAVRIARWDGEAWSPLGSGMNNYVFALETHDGALYAGGSFTTAGGQSASKIAKWDGKQWTGLDTGMNNQVFALEAHHDGESSALYAGGLFTIAGHAEVNFIAKWNGKAWAPVGSGMNGNVKALQSFNDGSGPALFAGGHFGYADDLHVWHIAKWNGQKWNAVGDGANGPVHALEIYNDGGGDALYAGGNFTAVDGQSVNRIAKWDGSTWSPLDIGVNDSVHDLLAYEDEYGPTLVLGGNFTTAGTLQANGLVKWDGSGWTNRDLGNQGIDGTILTMIVYNDGSGSDLYAGGSFTTAGGITASNIAKWDGIQWHALGSGVNGGVNALAVYNDGTGAALYAGGSFDTAGDSPASSIAKWNGEEWQKVEGVVESVDALAVYDDALYAGGFFTNAGGQRVYGIAKWDGPTWSQLDDGFIGLINALISHEDGDGARRLYVGGSFEEVDTVPAQRIATWNGTELSPLITGTNGNIHEFATFNDGDGTALYAAGGFTSAGGLDASRIAKWDGSSWNPLTTGLDGSAKALTTYNDGYGKELYVGGLFAQAGGVPAHRVAKWNGTRWAGLGTGLDDHVHSLATFNDGNGTALYVGGQFTTAGGLQSSGIAKWNCPVISDADIAVEISNNVNWLVAGGNTEYTVTVTNPTSFDALGVTLTNSFPPELSCSWTSSTTGGATGASAGNGSVLEDTLNMPAQSTVIYTIPCDVDELATGQVINTVSLNAPDDPDTTDNVATDTDSIVFDSDADLEVTLHHGLHGVVAGGTVTYSLDVRNLGPDDDDSAYLTLTLPPEINQCGWSAMAYGGATGHTSSSGSLLSEILFMPAKSTVRYLVTCDVPAALSGSLDAIANVNGTFDPLTDNNSANDQASVILRSTVETLILTNYSRMRSKLAITDVDLERLQNRLHDFANHSSVQGAIIDIGYGTDIRELYQRWDDNSAAGGSDPTLANFVLLGCHEPFLDECGPEKKGIHDLLLEKLADFPTVKSLMIIGDDRIVPMARIRDFTDLPSEFDYTSDERGYIPGITAENTTVGQALSQEDPGLYLSDDPLAVGRPISLKKLQQFRATILTDLGVGRLVETTDEIVESLNIYLAQEGLLDISNSDRRVMVTGYDFLIDVGKRVRERWKNAFNVPSDPNNLFPVDGQLISPTWGEATVEERRTTLLDHLSGTAQVGPGEGSYGILSLNGHANHYQLGVPSLDVTDIQGLGTERLNDLDINGAVVYAVGCHSGLPVAGENTTPEDHPNDLPQALLGQGAAAYLANSGFGWGLLHGVGYSERLVEIFTEELSSGSDVRIGDAMRNAKTRYYQEATPFDRYDSKTLLQWTLFGFPMYTVRPGIVPSALDSTEGAILVENQQLTNTPEFMIAQRKGFDLTAPGLFTKYKANGDLAEGPGCITLPDEPEGCYYTLNGLATSTADLPIEPMFIENSRLVGTNQRGVLWMGGRYIEEKDWTPVFGQLVSNGGPLPSQGPLPSTTLIKPRPTSSRGSTGPSGCPLADTGFNTVVFTTAELLFDKNNEPTIHRLHPEVNLEVLYYNNTADPSANCDTKGPELPQSDDPPHTVSGNTVLWEVPTSDPAGVWRVVVVYDDEIHDRWVPLELAANGDGTWSGQLDIPVEMSRLTYFLQAVDNRGNVSWVDYEPVVESSGIELDLPAPLAATRPAAEAADLAATLQGPEEVLNNGNIQFEMEVENLGPDPALAPSAHLDLGGAAYLTASWEMGWDCQTEAGTVSCTGTMLEPLATSSISVFAAAPDTGGNLTATMTTALENDNNPTNDEATIDVVVINQVMTDLAIEMAASTRTEGDPVDYSITVTNRGPHAVYGGTVTDVFPTELENIEWVCASSVGSSCTQSGKGHIFDTINLDRYGTLIYNIEASIVEGEDGVIVNQATVEMPPEMTDYQPNNNMAQVEINSILFVDGFESGDCSEWTSAPNGCQ